MMRVFASPLHRPAVQAWDSARARPRAARGAAIETVFEDRWDGAVGAGADVEAALAGRFKPVGPVMARQAQNADRGAVSLFGVRPALQDQRHQLGCVRTDCRRVGADAL